METRTSKPSLLIAAFDLDHTLLKPKGKTKFPKDRDDAILMYPQVGPKLVSLRKDGYKIVIFTNQKGIGKHTTLEDLFYKIDKYLPGGPEMDVYVSYADDGYRKPALGMFDKFMEDNGSVNDLFYVGDAAGRKGDFSASDAKFAYNAGITFYTPEEYFLDKKVTIPTIVPLKPPKSNALKRPINEGTVVIMIGMPGVGKSTLTEEFIEKYEDLDVVSNDILGSSAKSERAFKRALKEGSKRIIVDNTNASLLNRAAYTEPAIDAEYKVIAIYFDVDYTTAMHLNKYRAYSQERDAIPEIAYRSYQKRFVAPTKSEGYSYVVRYVPKYDPAIFEMVF